MVTAMAGRRTVYFSIAVRARAEMGYSSAVTRPSAITCRNGKTYIQLPKGGAEEESNNTPLISLKEFPRGGEVHYFHAWIDTLRLDPDEDEFNLEGDFGYLLNELVRFFDEEAGESGKLTGVGE